MKQTALILIVIVIVLCNCSEEFSPGPDGPLGPQGDVGPKGPVGPSSDDFSTSDAIEIKDTGKLVERDYDLKDFTEVEVGGFFTAEISQGEEFQVIVEAEEKLMPYIEVAVQGDRLKVGLASGHVFNMETASQRVEITVPDLSQVNARGHSTLYFNDFESDEPLEVEAVDFGSLLGSITAEEVEVEVIDHSSLILSGSASKVTGEVTNHSSADLSGLSADEVDVVVDRFSEVKQ